MKARPAATDHPSCHAMAAGEVLERLGVDPDRGLSSEAAAQRLAQYGENRLSPARRMGEIRRFLLQFHQPLLYVLLAATVVTLLLGEWVDASVIFAVVLVNAVVGYLQESRAERAIEALQKMVVTEATVRRDGRRQRVRSEALVPGDIVLLEAGDHVPADLRLLHVRNLRVDESALTGESVPVPKETAVAAADTILAERTNLAFAGTAATYGRGEGVVWATGDRTEAGRIATLITQTTSLSTPLTRKIARFSRLLTVAILALAMLTFGVGIGRGQGAVETFMAAVALSVGAIPEGLPAAVTVTLAIGVARMARRRAIIRKLPAVETLGSTTVICSDKTGTLTQNQMTVQKIVAGGRTYDVTGTGYLPEGRFLLGGEAVDPSGHPALAECLTAGLLCNEAQVTLEAGQPSVQGDPTEAALVVAAMKGGLVHEQVDEALPRLDVIPFESEHQYMATLHGTGGGEPQLIYKKGAVERLLERCDTQLDERGEVQPLDPAAVRRSAELLASEGLRVLAFARRAGDEDQQQLGRDHVASGLTLLGLQGMIDPPRPEAAEAVRECRAAGIEVKMITGDHALTAGAVAAKMELGSRQNLTVVGGGELEAMAEADLPAAAARAEVFARVAPEQKLRLVRAFQARGEVVAMTGDGVNDAPALRQADIGVAMGITGTDVAKGAADVVLTDDNFASIEAAVEEGRNIFDNLTKFILWTLPTNGAEAAIILAAILLGTALPAEPVQILWVNMTTAIFLGLMLVFEPREPNLMRRPPRDPQAPILDLLLLGRIALVTAIILVGAFGLFLWSRRIADTPLAQAQTVVINTIVMGETFYLLNCRSLTRSMFAIGLMSNRWIWPGIAAMLAAQLLITYAPVMNRLFHTAPIPAVAWAGVVLVGVVVYAAVGLEKWLRFGRSDRSRRGPGPQAEGEQS
ncbi:MAG: HAD-IC family P-type ATPase [Phycisphaeraceae bacterium]